MLSNKARAFFVLLLKGGALVYFTEGKLIEYERIMQENPGFDHRLIKTMKERDCKHCLYFDEHLHKCSKEKCIVFND